MELFLTVCVTSLTLGLLYSLFAAGMGLVLRSSGDLNLAHGDSLMLATYVALGTLHLTGVAAFGVLADIALGAIVGVIAYLAIYGPIAGRGGRARGSSAAAASTAGFGFLPSLGVALVVRNLAERASPRGSNPMPSLFAGSPVRLFAGYRLPGVGWWILAAGIAVPIMLSNTLRRTRTGRRMQAVADDPILARLCGVPVPATLAVSYALAGAIGGLAGALFSSFFGLVFIALGWQATLKGFVAAVLGGIGSLKGALIGGLTLGVVESFSSAYISTTYKDAVTYVLLIAVLIAAPAGILERGRLRQV